MISSIFNSSARWLLIAGLLGMLQGCGDAPPPGSDATPKTPSADEPAAREAAEPREPPSVFGISLEPYHGDFEGLRERRFLRVLVGFSRTHFFLDGLTPRGLSADSLKEFEKYLRRTLGIRPGNLTLVTIPVARDQMIQYLADGLGDLAVGNLTVTPERLAQVDFSVPAITGVQEVVVMGPSAGPVATLDDLSGRQVFIRQSSSFRESLENFNAALAERGMDPVEIIAADENLQTEDILELVNAGAIGMTIADSHLAEFWSGVLPDIRVRDDLAISSDRSIGWAIRKSATGFKAHVDKFIRANRKGTLVGNVLFQRYLQNEDHVRNAGAGEDWQRLQALSKLFRQYSDQYTFDWLLIAAQGYQESRLIHDTRSSAGAVGVMQILPRTARIPAVGISDIQDVEANIHAGHKYLRHLIDDYFDEPGMTEFNRTLFGFAAYNAGPTRIRRIRRMAAAKGLDPNVWFGNVELLVAEQVGREPVQYVRNILKYYTTYALLRENREQNFNAAGAD